jgi:ribosome-associated translation inhibitor RaiA
MGLLSGITSCFKQEATDAKAAVDQLEQRLDVDLGRKERELAASPSERLDMLQDEIDQSSGLDAVREKIERSARRCQRRAQGRHRGAPQPSRSQPGRGQ